MRDAYHAELDGVTRSLVEMSELARNAMREATRALLDADLERAAAVISGDEGIDLLRREVEQRTFDLLAQQQPVASDLRLLVTSLRIVADLERMGDLALNVARLARRRHPSPAVPEALQGVFVSLGAAADSIAAQTTRVLQERDVSLAGQVEATDDVLDDLHREVLRSILHGPRHLAVEEAVDASLAARFYERFGDHAVSVSRRVIYLVTGERPDIPSQFSGHSSPVTSIA